MAHVYIIEDDIDLGIYLQAELEEAGHKVSLFRLASDAIEAFRTYPADIVVADLIIRDHGRVLPDGGLSAIWRIRQSASTQKRSVFIVAISGSARNTGMGTILSTADLMGADATLTKPFDPADLIYVIERQLKVQETPDGQLRPAT